jgi:peroxiredoxin
LQRWNDCGRDFEALGVQLVAVSPDTCEDLEQLQRKRHWKITLLADPSSEIIRLYNLHNRKFSPKRGPFRELAIPTTVLIDAAGKVRWMEQTPDFRVRSQAELVLAKIRPILSPVSRSGSGNAGNDTGKRGDLCVQGTHGTNDRGADHGHMPRT